MHVHIQKSKHKIFRFSELSYTNCYEYLYKWNLGAMEFALACIRCISPQKLEPLKRLKGGTEGV